MEEEAKGTYAIIGALIIVLGGLAYYLQGNLNLPQVQVVGNHLVASTSTPGIMKKNILTVTNTTKGIQDNSTTTMELPEKITSATITTNKGVIEITFNSNTPEAVKNFAKLATEGFYNGTRFHRIIRDFMIQGGDPLSKDLTQKNRWGTGGPGYSFEDEVSKADVFNQGTVAMANSGPNTNGSQFFIVTAVAGTPWLSGKHTIFGHVTSGLENVLRIGNLQTDGSDKPLEDVIVEKIEIR